ncbi:19065_t:CDS:2, partial [Gigaspora rosea]
EGIKKLEPDVTKKRFYWKAFWNFLKSLNGIWGDSAIKSERKSFLLKSMISWEKVEEIALKEAWSMLDKETTRNLKSSALRRAIFGQHDCRQKDVRLAVIKYVFPIEIIEEVQKLGIEHNEGKLLVDKLLFFLWKGFFEI